MKKVDKIIANLKNQDAEKRIDAIKTLSENKEILDNLFNFSDLTASLIDCLNNDIDIEVRRMALAMIVTHGRKFRQFVDPLIACLKDQDSVMQELSAWKLGVLKAKEAVYPLIEALNDKNPLVRANIAEALGHIGDPRAIDPLIKTLIEDNSSEVIREATRALALLTASGIIKEDDLGSSSLTVLKVGVAFKDRNVGGWRSKDARNTFSAMVSKENELGAMVLSFVMDNHIIEEERKIIEVLIDFLRRKDEIFNDAAAKALLKLKGPIYVEKIKREIKN